MISLQRMQYNSEEESLMVHESQSCDGDDDDDGASEKHIQRNKVKSFSIKTLAGSILFTGVTSFVLGIAFDRFVLSHHKNLLTGSEILLNQTESESYLCKVCKRNSSKENGHFEPNVHLSPFSQLTEMEVNSVVKFLQSRKYISTTQKFNESRITHLYLHPPNKQHVLEYLDRNGSLPARFAHVHVIRPEMQPPDVIEYKIGPLNALTNMVAEQLIKDGVININRRPNDEMENYELFKFINITLHVPGLDSLLRESFDSASFGNNISVMFYQLPTVNANERISHMNLYLQIDDEGEGDASLRLLPISCFVHHAGTNVANWKASDWFYASQGPFYSSEDLNDAYGLGTLRMVRYPKGYIKQHTNEFNVRKDDTMPERDFSNIPPPRTYTEHGKRYKINGYRITYLGWQFEFSLHPVRGPVIYDIRFKENRIAYEISLQDITLLYHPGSNGYGPLTLTDTAFLLGTGSREPRPGLDCPKWGNILDVNGTFQWYHVGPWAGVCVFEADGQRALWRHRARGMVDYFLVVRTILTLGNYDYVVEWEFHVDGRIETMLTASGYLFGSWDDGLYNSSMFGFRIGDFLLGPIHDHTYSFKVDIDVLGIQNSFQTLTWEAGDINAAFQSDDRRTFSGNNNMFYFNQTRFIRDTIYQNETSVVWNPHQPKYYMVVNERERNKWGSLRGYRIVPYSTEQEILKDHPLLNSWNHLKYQIAISKRKESEPYLTNTFYSTLGPFNIADEAGKMTLDDESIVNEDVVLWISEKFLHIPCAEDVPMTISVKRGFTLKPFNYFDSTPVFDLPAFYSDSVDPYDYQQCPEEK